jgi:murein DD-endopeptidase MepM/ murein hydrolase activator NlpD
MANELAIGSLKTTDPKLLDNATFKQGTITLLASTGSTPPASNPVQQVATSVVDDTNPNTGETGGGEDPTTDTGTGDGTTPTTPPSNMDADSPITAGPLPIPEFVSTIAVPPYSKENFEYWTVSELVSFRLEAALGARWSTLSSQAMLDGISIAKSAGGLLKGIGDIVGGLLGITEGQPPYQEFPSGTFVIPVAGYDMPVGDIIEVDPPYSNANYPVKETDSRGFIYITKNHRSFGAGRPGAADIRQSWPGGGHQGVDFMCPNKQPVVAPFNGKLISKGTSGSAGNHLHFISDDGRWEMFGCHLFSQETIVPVNTTIKQGGVMALASNTGCQAYHLHFQICDLSKGAYSPRNFLDPCTFLKGAVILDKNGNDTNTKFLPPKGSRAPASNGRFV